MRNLLIYISALTALSSGYGLRHGSSQLRDLLAFPKYEVQFLNHLPISEQDAAKCLTVGVEREEQWSSPIPWSDQRSLSYGIEGTSAQAATDHLELVRMALKPPNGNTTNSYLCLMPSLVTLGSQTDQAKLNEHEDGIDPTQSWLALSHLDGNCLYARQGWFTYAYCHNSHLRQFRAAPHKHPHPPGGYVPEEDTNFDAYTLGQAHPAPRKARSSLPQGQKAKRATIGRTNENPETAVDRPNQAPTPGQGSITASLSGSSRYLSQRWSDGTRCDKTGRPRETEIQIHCSMTAHDQIYLVKELAICQYVVIIHSPYLCSLPGFRPEKVNVEAAGIRCRQVLADEEYQAWKAGSGPPAGDGYTLRPPGLEPKRAPTIPGSSGLADGPSLKELLKKALDSKSSRSRTSSGNPNQHLSAAPEGQDPSQDGSDTADSGNNEEDEVVFISWEEDEQGNQAVLLDAGTILSKALGDTAAAQLINAFGGETERERDKQEQEQMNFGDDERKMIMDAVRQFLEKKGHGQYLMGGQEEQEQAGEEEDGRRGDQRSLQARDEL